MTKGRVCTSPCVLPRKDLRWLNQAGQSLSSFLHVTESACGLLYPVFLCLGKGCSPIVIVSYLLDKCQLRKYYGYIDSASTSGEVASSDYGIFCQLSQVVTQTLSYVHRHVFAWSCHQI